jgi:hypothetical protein
MEWLKLRSVRSTWYIVAVFAVGLVGVAMLVLSHQQWAQMSAADRASFDPVNDSYTDRPGVRRADQAHGRRDLRGGRQHVRAAAADLADGHLAAELGG